MGIKNASIMPVLAVDDIERATAFYRDKLGCDVQRLEDDPSGGVVVRIGERDRLFLYKTTFARGENTVASLIVDDVESTVGELRSRGVEFEEYDLPGLKTENGIATYGEGMKAAWFKDTEGNTISINPDLELALRKAA
jgi:catechol 2,3-dioxygenase-like lactoylglutathione lyase family enzyme